MHGTLQLQQCQVVLESSRIVVPVHDDPLDILCHSALLLKIARNVELSEHGHQVGQETESACLSTWWKMQSLTSHSPWLAMGCRNDIVLGNQYSTALVLREEAQPGRFTNQHLPGILSESRTLAADNSARLHRRACPANCKKGTIISLQLTNL